MEVESPVTPLIANLMRGCDFDGDGRVGLCGQEDNRGREKGGREKGVCKTMFDTIKEMSGLEIDEDPIGYPKMYVFTNTKMIQGSAVMLTKTFLEKVQTLFGDNATIIPSSVHELIVVENPQGMDLASIIKEVNETQVSASEWLGDYPYEYVDGKIFCREDLGDPIEKDIL